MNTCHSIRSGYAAWLVLLIVFLSGCAPAPIANQEVMSLYPGSTAWGVANPYFTLISGASRIAVWPIQSGTSSGMVGWGIACQSGACPEVPGTFVTAPALSQFINYLAQHEWQVFNRAGMLLRVPLVVPLAPFEDYMQEQPKS